MEIKQCILIGFGIAEEDINCRCVLLERARWAIEKDEDFTKNIEGNIVRFENTKNYQDFKEKYFDFYKNNDKITAENLFNKLNIDIYNYDLIKQNDIQEKASNLLKFDKLPQIVNKDEFEKVNCNEIVRYLHDSKNITANDAYENTLYGEIQYSNILNSQFGRGIYFGDKTENEELSSLYGKNQGKAINAKISEKAKILEFNSKISFIKDVNERIEKLPKELQMIYKKECSLLYMLDGYDGIKINGKNYYCIYNRKVLIVKDGK